MFDMFDDMFDFDSNGELDIFEESAKFSFMMGMIEESEKDDDDNDTY